MLQSDGNLTAAARARAIRRLERNDEYKNIDARIYTSEFSSNFEIKNYKADSIKPVPDFFERLRICRLSTRPSFRKSNLGLLCQFIFDKPYSRNVDIDEFEVEQSSRDTNCWPSSFFSASYEEGTLYVRYNSLSELEVLDPNNGNLEKLRQVFKKTIDGRALNVSDFWAPCPINFEEAKQYLFPNIISSNPSESEEECLAK
jgi:hypothetical protein